jgi:protein-disulfide isomerase
MVEGIVGAELSDQLANCGFSRFGEEAFCRGSSVGRFPNDCASSDSRFASHSLWRSYNHRALLAISIDRVRSTMNPTFMNQFVRAFVLSFFLSVALAATANAQFSNPESPTTAVKNAAPLHPPAGARVAVVEFEDLECPDCARANPVIKEAIEKYHVPWVRHDFPLPFHTWSFEAAVDARWFDTKSKKLGDEFRDATFAAQPTIHSQEDLQAFAQKFAADHKVSFPFAADPQGRLAQMVKADSDLGQSVGVQHTPTIWVVTDRTSGAPFVEVVDRSRLFTLIEEAQAETGPKPR